MSSDDEDYMSDKFLAASATKDCRPGLVKNRSRQREYENQAKKFRTNETYKQKNLPVHKISEVQLKAGLSTALSTDNKGFAMLAKMGYKQGDSLGKQGTGITEPIPLAVKSDRAGFGRETAMKQLAEYRENKKRQRAAQASGEAITPEEFRRRMVQKSQLKQVEGDLRKSQKACEGLDQDNDVTEPAMKWFWPERFTKKPVEDDEEADEAEADEEEEEEEEAFEPSEKLEMITNYLRTTYLYCNWCGVKYEDAADMENCPGNTKDDH